MVRPALPGMRPGAASAQRLAEPVRVVASVADEHGCGGHGIEHEGGTLVVAHLPFAQQQDAGSPALVADRVQLGVQAALGASDTSGNIPLFKRLAAVR